jgi:hypothetical protein
LHGFAGEAGVSLEEQRTDTTMFMSNIKKAGRMSLAYDVLTQAVKAIPKDKLTDSLSKVLEPSFKTDILYRSKQQDGDSKLSLLLNRFIKLYYRGLRLLRQKAVHLIK